jgi:hypothetical protein
LVLGLLGIDPRLIHEYASGVLARLCTVGTAVNNPAAELNVNQILTHVLGLFGDGVLALFPGLLAPVMGEEGVGYASIWHSITSRTRR